MADIEAAAASSAPATATAASSSSSSSSPTFTNKSASKQEQLKQLGHSKLEDVLSKAHAGHNPFEFHQQPRGGRQQEEELDADVRAVGLALERHRNLLLTVALVVAQGASWMLLKGSLLAMHTPAVMAFLHLLAAALLQLLLMAYGVLPAAAISAPAARGCMVPAALSGLKVLLVMVVLEHSSVYLLVCWVCVVPLLLATTRAADISANKGMVSPLRGRHHAWLALACAGLGLELFLDTTARPLVALIALSAWACVVLLELVVRQLKVDATLGHRIMEPNFLFRARELSDLEDSQDPSTKAFLVASLPALPILVLGLVLLEAKDLVEHEPSVPTLEVLLLSCLAFAAVHNLHALLAQGKPNTPPNPSLHAAAAIVAVMFELMERFGTLGTANCLFGVALCLAGCLAHNVSAHKKSAGVGQVAPM